MLKTLFLKMFVLCVITNSSNIDIWVDQVSHRPEAPVLTSRPISQIGMFSHFLWRMYSAHLSWYKPKVNEVYSGPNPSSIQVSWKSIEEFLCSPVYKPTNQQTDRQTDKGKNITPLVEVLIMLLRKKTTMFTFKNVLEWKYKAGGKGDTMCSSEHL